MNANTLHCFNKLIMQIAFLLKPFSNNHQTTIDMNTKVQFGFRLFCQCLRLHFFFLQPLFLTFQPMTVHSKISTSVGPVHCSRDPQPHFSITFFIKNGSHSTIYTFKNYFATVFFIFQFSVFNKISCIQMDSKCEHYQVNKFWTLIHF